MTTRDELGERTFPPTPRRRREARLAGQVARSPDLVGVISLGAGIAGLAAFGPSIVEALRRLLAEAMGAAAPAGGLGLEGFFARLSELALPTAGLGLTIVAGAALANLVQVGAVVTWQPVAPRAGRLSWWQRRSEQFWCDAIVRCVLCLMKLGAVAALAWAAIRDMMPALVGAAGLTAAEFLGRLGSLALSLACRVMAALLALACADYVYRRWQHERSLRMTRRERQEEQRLSEGDAIVKARRREIGKAWRDQWSEAQ